MTFEQEWSLRLSKLILSCAKGQIKPQLCKIRNVVLSWSKPDDDQKRFSRCPKIFKLSGDNKGQIKL